MNTNRGTVVRSMRHRHEQAMHPFYPATPMHECESSWNPECGKCNACQAWGDYVLICHPLGDTEEEDNDD